jgi:hypothetical protein
LEVAVRALRISADDVLTPRSPRIRATSRATDQIRGGAEAAELEVVVRAPHLGGRRFNSAISADSSNQPGDRSHPRSGGGCGVGSCSPRAPHLRGLTLFSAISADSSNQRATDHIRGGVEAAELEVVLRALRISADDVFTPRSPRIRATSGRQITSAEGWRLRSWRLFSARSASPRTDAFFRDLRGRRFSLTADSRELI